MDFDEWTRKRQESGEQDAGSSIPMDNTPSSFGEWSRKSQGQMFWRDEEVGFDAWLESLSNFSNTINKDAQGRAEGYQSAESLGKYKDKTYATIDGFTTKSKEYRDYFNTYRSMYEQMYGKGSLDGILKALDEGDAYLTSVRDGIGQEYSYWSQFKDEEDYNGYLKGKEYANLSNATDFADKSQYVSTYRGNEKFNAWIGMYTDTGFDDITYDYINKNQKALDRQMLTDISTNASLLGIDKSFLKEMSDDEIAVFNYIYATEGKDPAYKYIEFLTQSLTYRQRVKNEEEWAKYASEHPIGSSIFSILESPLKGLSYIGQMADYAEDGKIDQNAGYNKFSYINSAIRNEVTGIVEENWGGAGSFAYQVGMSMGDFLFTTAATGGQQAFALAVMGTGAAADATIAAKDRGLDDNQAFALGTIAGAAEIVTEKLSLDALLDSKTLGKSAAAYMLKNSLAEGSEEVGSDIINLVADVLISQDKSQWQLSIDAYMDAGKTEQEAFNAAFWDQMESMGLDFLGGALSGGIMSGAGVGINALNANQVGAQIRANYSDNAFIAQALANSEVGSESYKMAQALASRIEQDGAAKISDHEIGQLYLQMQAEATESQNKESSETSSEPAQQQVASLVDLAKSSDRATAKYATAQLANPDATVVSPMAQTFMDTGMDARTATEQAQLLQKISAGQTLTKAEIKQLRLSNESVRTTFSEITGIAVTDAQSRNASQKRNIIKSATEVAQQKAKTQAAIQAAEKVNGHLQREQQAADRRAAAESAAVSLLNDAITREESTPHAGPEAVQGQERSAQEPSIQFADGSSQTRSEFVKAYMQSHKGATEAKARSVFSQYQQYNQMGKKAPGSASGRSGKSFRTSEVENEVSTTVPASKPRSPFSVLSQKFTEKGKPKNADRNNKSRKKVTSPVEGSQRKTAQEYEQELTIKRLNGVASKFGATVRLEDMPDTGGTTVRNGYFDPETKTIVVNAKRGTNQYLITRYFAHEVTHLGQESDIHLTADILKVMKEIYGAEKVAKMQDQTEAEYRRHFVENGMDDSDINTAYIQDELAANFLMTAIEKRQLLDRLSGLKPSIPQRLAMFVDSFIKSSPKGQKVGLTEMDKLMKRMRSSLVSSAAEGSGSFDGREHIETEKGELVMERDGGEVLLSISTYDAEGRDLLSAFLARAVNKGDLSQQDANDIWVGMEQVYEIAKDLKKDYNHFAQWSDAEVRLDRDGRPVGTVRVKNGDYEMNFDFSTVCKKRQTLNAVLNQLMREGATDLDFSNQRTIVDINNIIKSHGFEIACAMCFVDAKRFRVGDYASTFRDMWNGLAESLIPQGSSLTLNTLNPMGETTSPSPISAVPDEQLNWEKVDSILAGYTGGAMTTEQRIAQSLKTDPSSRVYLNDNMLMSSESMDLLRAKYPSIYGPANSHQGAGKPKIAHDAVQWRNEIINDPSITPEKAFAVGGVRAQSFSDFVVTLFFDYVEMFSEMAAKQLPGQSYTKEAAYVELFGLTGEKINMSLIPAVQLLSEDQKAEFKMNPTAEAEFKSRVGLDENGNYIWADESFDYATALDLQARDGYKENVGTICVGVSDGHIRKLLADKFIHMVIPYHKSGLNPLVAKANNIHWFTDYTKEQHETYASGAKTGKNVSKSDHKKIPDFYELLKETGDPKQAAELFVRACEDNGVRPRFSQRENGEWLFCYKLDGNGQPVIGKDGRKVVDENYYKVLADYSLYDNDGNYTPQRAVKLELPSNTREIVERYLSEYEDILNRRDAEISQIVKDVREQLGNKAGKQKLSVSVKDDTAYWDAINRGDMDAAQELVEDAAKSAGYTIEAYHGTNADFTVYDKTRLGKGLDKYGSGFYFANKRQVSENFGEKVYPTYLKMENPIRIRVDNSKFEDTADLRSVKVTQKQAAEIISRHPLMNTEESPLGDFFPEYWDVGVKPWMVKELAKKYTSLGYLETDLFKGYPNEFHEAVRDVTGHDGVVVYHDDGNTFSFDEPDFFYVAWFDTQMKSSEPVVRDDDGKVVPPSERFNETKNDIRYSVSEDIPETGKLLLETLESTLIEIKETGSWSGGSFRSLYTHRPDCDYIVRIQNKDASALSELKQLVDGISDIDLLYNLRWYPVQARFADFRKAHRSAINKYNKIIDTRISELRAQKAGGRNIGFEIREYSLAEMHEMFDSLNSNEELSRLADKVFTTAERFGIKASGAKRLVDKDTAGVSYGSHVQFKESYMNSLEYTDQQKASTILHEYLHAGTVYAIAYYNAPQMRRELSTEMKLAVRTLEEIYSEIKRDPEFKGSYGIKNVNEMIAELANEQFRMKLEKKNLFQRIVDAIKQLFGIKSNTAFDGVSGAVEYILENGSAKLHRDYARAIGYDQTSHALYSISTTVDSKGRNLSAEQQAFFEDSKVRDENGRLLSVYHGTKNGNFTVFQYDPNRQTDTDFGKAYYFTTDYENAKGYAKDNSKDARVQEYLDAKGKMLQQILAEEDPAKRDALIQARKAFKLNGMSLNDILADTDYETGGEVKEMYLNLTNPLVVDANGGHYRKLYPQYFAEAKQNGNDGIIVKNVEDKSNLKAGFSDVFIAFEPEQIKNIDNRKPSANPDIRYSISGAEDANTVIRKLETEVKKSRSGFGKYAAYSNARLDREIKLSSDKYTPGYAKSYITWISPYDFIRATTSGIKDRFFLEEEAGALDVGKLSAETQPIYLDVDFETGQIRGHEGRHRMIALKNAGVTKVAVILDARNHNKANTQPIAEMRLLGQKLSNGQGSDFIASGILPLSEQYADTVRRLFGDEKSYLRYSVSPDTGYEEGSIQDRVLTLLRSGTVEDAVDLLQQWADDIEAGRTTVGEGEASLRDALLAKRPIDAQEAAQKRAQLDEMIKRYGKIDQGEKPSRAVFLPRETVENRKVSKYSRTVAEASQTPQWFVAEVERAVADGDAGFTYNIATNKAAMDYVESRKRYGFDANLKEWERIVDTGNGSGALNRITKDDIALGEFLYSEAVKAGDVATATRLVAELSAIGTQAGQAVQAMSLLKRLTPSGQLYYLQKAVDRINRDSQKHVPRGKRSEVTIDPDLAQDVLEAENAEDMQTAMDALLQDVANQVPVTFAEKWNTWRYFAMLGNPRTHIRNLASNVIFAPVTWLKDVVGATIETGAQAIGLIKAEDRTKHLGQAFAHIGYDLSLGKKKPTKYTDFAAKDYVAMEDTLRGGGKYNPSDLIRDKRPIFKSAATRWVNTLSNLNSKALDAEDAIFLKRSYVNALSQYLAAHGADVDTLENTAKGRTLLAKARGYAIQEAQKATFRDMSALANALSKLERSGIAGQFIVGGIVPFKKTPINVLKRGVEYSPLGLAKSLSVNLMQLAQGKKTATECIDGISAGLSGTGIMMLGVYLASQGLLRAGAGGDEKEAAFEELQGAQKYSFVVNNMSYTIDWMAPAALPLFIGCEVYNAFAKDEELSTSDLADTLLLVAEPMFSLSMLDGLNSTLTTAGYSDNPLSAVASSVFTGYIGQAVPTLLGQIARSIDGTRRTTYVDKNSDIPDVLSRFLQSNVMSKMPLLSQDLTPKLDAWGRTDTVNNKLLGALENFLSPGYANMVETSAMEEELQRLYTVTGNASVLPKSAPKYFNVDKVRYDLSAEEWVNYQTKMGQGAYEMLTELVNSQAYQSLTDTQKADVIADIYTYANEKAKKDTVPEYDIASSWIEKADALTEQGLSVGDYIVQAVIGAETAGQNTLDVLQMDWLSDNDRALLISAAYTKSLTNGNTFTDPFRTGFAYTMTGAQTEEYLAYFDDLWVEEYNKLISKSRYKKSKDTDKAEMLDELKGEVADRTKKWMARKLRKEGVKSTKKE